MPNPGDVSNLPNQDHHERQTPEPGEPYEQGERFFRCKERQRACRCRRACVVGNRVPVGTPCSRVILALPADWRVGIEGGAVLRYSGTCVSGWSLRNCELGSSADCTAEGLNMSTIDDATGRDEPFRDLSGWGYELGSKPMSFKMECPRCMKTLNVTEKAFGKTVPCPNCNQPIKVPQPTQPSLQASPVGAAPPWSGARRMATRRQIQRRHYPLGCRRPRRRHASTAAERPVGVSSF